MTTRKTRVYDKEFKLSAVKLHIEEGRSAKEVSEGLGIPYGTFSGWLESYKNDGKEAFPGKGSLKASDAELAQLRKELAIAREEGDILKKALGIFSSLRK